MTHSFSSTSRSVQPPKTAGAGSVLHEFYRLPAGGPTFATAPILSSSPGFFLFGRDIVGYGRCAGQPSENSAGALFDVLPALTVKSGVLQLPFDAARVIDDLRNERYLAARSTAWKRSKADVLSRAYYALRPAMPVWCRKHLQRFRLRGWQHIPFPCWPVDTSVDSLLERLLFLFLKASQIDQAPFIWFWPQGLPACAVITHDVETQKGLDFSETLMHVDDSFAVKSCFNLVPEKRYRISQALTDRFRKAGFELNVHDFNHDGHLFRSRSEFLRRAIGINTFARNLGAAGFRSAGLYRNQQWIEELNFAYDMSVPNVGHLDPQRGGCCTVFPYFLGHTLEIPLTTTQDYSLFHILSDSSTTLWRQQTAIIFGRHGLATFLIHPDYVTKAREFGVYKSLLKDLTSLREQKRLWIALPGEVALWWKKRSQMSLHWNGNSWQVSGDGSERATVAYARVAGNKLVYDVN